METLPPKEATPTYGLWGNADVDAAVKQREDEEHSARQRVQEMEQATIRELQKQLAGLTTQENMWIQR